MIENVTDSVIYVGCDDTTDPLFESQYAVPNGMAYNSYVVKGEKTAVMDTVDKKVIDQWMNNVNEAVNGAPVDYLVVQHLEPDHSAAIATFMDAHPETTLVTSVKAASMLPNFAVGKDYSGRMITVKEGDELDLGGRKLHFVQTPMVHWPEVIMSYDDKDKILFCADAFGKFGTRKCQEDWDDEAARYFLNIVGKYGVQVQNVLKKAAGLDIAVLAPLHGPILTEDLGHYIKLYDIWSSYKPDKEGIFIPYASIHGHTNEVAFKLKEILEAKGQTVKLLDLTRGDVHEAAANCYRYPKIILVACSYDAGVFPPMERMLNILSHKNFQNRTIGFVENGSWAPSAAKTMVELLSKCRNLDLIEPVVTSRTSLKDSDLPALEKLADDIISA